MAKNPHALSHPPVCAHAEMGEWGADRQPLSPGRRWDARRGWEKGKEMIHQWFLCGSCMVPMCRSV